MLLSCLVGTATTLTACTNNSPTVASINNQTLTQSEIYSYLLDDDNAQTKVKNLILMGVYDTVYGKEIKDKQVDEMYEKYASDMGDDEFKTQLEAFGYTKDTFKDFLRKQLAFEFGLKNRMKVSEEDINAKWSEYQEDQKVKMIVVDSQENADAAKQKLNGTTSFNEVAKEYSVVEQNEITVTYNDTATPRVVREAIYKLKDGEISDIITYDNNGASSFFIVQMVKSAAKPSKITDKIKEKLIEDIKTTRIAENVGLTEIIREELADQNFKLEDDKLQNVFADLIQSKKSGDESGK